MPAYGLKDERSLSRNGGFSETHGNENTFENKISAGWCNTRSARGRILIPLIIYGMKLERIL
jgi:hypothetical protein